MQSKQFQRQKEDFDCGHCGAHVVGNGYTNHCPVCLWSRHVDINPGDRQATCHGLMEPVGVETKSGDYTILHRCTVCGFQRKNKVVDTDNFDAVITLSRQLAR